MLHRGMSRSEIEKELSRHGNFVKIDYLTRFINEGLSLDEKRFAYLKLAEIYEQMGMLTDAAKTFDKIATISITFSEKIRNHLKEAELYVRAGRFDEVDESIKKAISSANASQKSEILFNIRNIYKREAENHEANKRRNSAAKIYAKLLEMQISEGEREQIRKKLENLRQKLGEKPGGYENL